MTKTLNKSRYKPIYKLKSQKHTPSRDTIGNLPPDLQNFKYRLLSGSGFITYKEFYIY